MKASVFINVAWANHSAFVDELAFRVYVTDSMKLYGENKHLSYRWYDQIMKETKEIDAKEIVDRVVKKGGLVVKKNESA